MIVSHRGLAEEGCLKTLAKPCLLKSSNFPRRQKRGQHGACSSHRDVSRQVIFARFCKSLIKCKLSTVGKPFRQDLHLSALLSQCLHKRGVP